jgi:hypothetical protein
MSVGKFASMTASLLARKGDAHPSTMPEVSRMNRLSGWNGFTPEPQQSSPAVHRQFQKLDNIFAVPPVDIRAAEGSADIRTAADVVADLRLREPAAVEDKPQAPVEQKARDKVEEKLDVVAPKQRETKLAVEPVSIDKPRRLFVNLTPQEYERLGIVAVKQDSTRHRLLREAFETFLAKASDDLGHDCACVAGACKGTCSA